MFLMDSILVNYLPFENSGEHAKVREAMRRLKAVFSELTTKLKVSDDRAIDMLVAHIEMVMRRVNTGAEGDAFAPDENVRNTEIGLRLPLKPLRPPHDRKPDTLFDDSSLLLGGGGGFEAEEKQLKELERMQLQHDKDIEKWEKKYDLYVRTDAAWITVRNEHIRIELTWNKMWNLFYFGDKDAETKENFCAMRTSLSDKIGVFERLSTRWTQARQLLLDDNERVAPSEELDDLRVAFEDINRFMHESVVDTLTRLAKYLNALDSTEEDVFPLRADHRDRDLGVSAHLPPKPFDPPESDATAEEYNEYPDAMSAWKDMSDAHLAVTTEWNRLWKEYYSSRGGGGGGGGDNSKFCKLRARLHKTTLIYKEQNKAWENQRSGKILFALV